MDNDKLQPFREEINQLDDKILELLNQRQSVSIEIGKYKRDNGLKLFDPGRENQVFKKLAGLNQGPLSEKDLNGIYREILSASLAAQAPLSAGYLGPEASFSHEAALGQFGQAADLVAVDSIRDVFRGVDRGRFSFGVVPVENSTQGGVGMTLDLFLEFNLSVCQEIRLRVSHNLMSSGRDLKDIKKIYSHPQVLSQSAGWLAANLPGVPQFELSSSSAAAIKAADEEGAAAVGSIIAAEIYNLNLIEKAIEDSEQNVTRFLVLADQNGSPTGKDKTSLIVTLEDKPGALYGLLKAFSNVGINMSKIESRPKKDENWKYNFFIDIAGHTDDEQVKLGLKEAQKHCTWLKVLGSYPQVD